MSRDSPAVTALLQRWRDPTTIPAYTHSRPGQRKETFSLIDTGSLAQRGEALIALTDPRLLDREFAAVCPFEEVAALAASLCGHLNENSEEQLVSAVIAGLLVGEEQLLGPSSKFQTDPAHFRDDVLLKLAALVKSDADTEALLQILSAYQPSEEHLPTIKPQLQTHAMVDSFFFKLAPLVTTVDTVITLVRMFTLSFAPLFVETRAELLWKPEIREFFSSLTAVVVHGEPTLLPDTKTAVSDVLAISMLTVAYHADESFEQCPLWNDREWYRTVLFPLLRMKHPTDLPVVLTTAFEQFPFLAQLDFYLTEEFRDGVLLPHISRKMRYEKLDAIVNIILEIARWGKIMNFVALKRVFVNTKSLTRCFGTIIKRSHDRLRTAANKQETIVPVTKLFEFLAELVGAKPESELWRGIETPVWSTQVFFDEILVPYLSVMQSEQVPPNRFCEVVFAFWVHRPTGVGADELRDKIIFPLAKMKYSGARVDVLPVMLLLLRDADSMGNHDFKDAFATRESEVMFLDRGIDPNEAFFEVAADCVLYLVQDGSVLNGRRADAVTDVCRRLLALGEYSVVIIHLMCQSPDEDDEAVVCRQAKLLDPQWLLEYLSRLNETPSSLTHREVNPQNGWSMSKPFFFTSLRRRICSTEVAAQQGFTQLLSTDSAQFRAVLRHVTCSTEAAMYLETLCFLVPVGGGGFLTAEDVAVLAPLCSTAASAAAMARLIDHVSPSS